MERVAITFLGVALYRKTKDNDGEETDELVVRLPNALPPKGKDPAKYWDGKDAAPHWPWLYAMPEDEGTEPIRIPLDGATIICRGKPASGPDSCHQLIDLNNVADDIALRPEAVTAGCTGLTITAVHLHGGRLVGPTIEKAEFADHLKKTIKPAPALNPLSMPIWDSEAERLQVGIRFEGAQQTLNLEASDWKHIIITNLDSPIPTPETIAETNCTAGQPVDDLDFKWLYQLLEPTDNPSKSLSERWMARLGGRELPFPRSICPSRDPQAIEPLSPLSPFVGKCLGARTV